jgi:hypothetical protein
MGLINQAIREIKQQLSNLWGSLPFNKRKKKRRKADADEEISVPRSWSRSRPGEKRTSRKQVIVQKHKLRVPGLRWFKRGLAAFLLLINFVFSQFLLSQVGGQGQAMFIIFLLNSFIMADYLWKTRRASQ